jgi:4-diphosphocytidyl-2-C-methyl-D-erythritol kinase
MLRLLYRQLKNTMEGIMRLRALAKINLGLDVIRKREDGYHEVRMIMQTIQMYDVLDIQKTEKKGISLSVNLPYIPTDERNLVYKAAKMLMDEFHIQEGVAIRLDKFIPVSAGMAGGSSDAAATFVGVNRLFNLGLNERELMERAVKVGADVPYCIMRGTALSEGIGEKLTRIPPMPKCYILIGKPGVNVSTKLAYENLDLGEISSHPDIDGMVEDIRRGDLYSMTTKMANVFEPGIIGRYPVIREIKELMEENGALKALMSGSGPTVFGVFDDAEKMERAAALLRESRLAKTVFATEVYNQNGGNTNDK